MHTSAKIDIVREKITIFSKISIESKDRQLIVNATKNLVDEYQDVIVFAQKIENVFSYQLLFHLILCTFGLCFVGYTFVMVSKIQLYKYIFLNIILLAVISCNFYHLCA